MRSDCTEQPLRARFNDQDLAACLYWSDGIAQHVIKIWYQQSHLIGLLVARSVRRVKSAETRFDRADLVLHDTDSLW
jgi:hypothetical protein